MVNKCSVPGCRSLYEKDNVKLHRFPLTNSETLPFWIATTGRGKDWKPGKSSRLCGHHFRESEYIIGHGKGILKSTAIPTIKYRTENPKYLKNIPDDIMGQNMDDLIKIESMVESDTDVEVIQLNYDDYSILNNDHKYNNNIDGFSENQEIPYFTQEYLEYQNNKTIEKNSKQTILNFEKDNFKFNDEDNNNHCFKFNEEDNTSHNKDMQITDNIKNEICNKQNQCYMFTSSFKEGAEPLVISPQNEKPFEESSTMIQSIDKLTADSNFNKVMALKRQKRTKDIYSLYFKSLRKRNEFKQERINIHSSSDDAAAFSVFIEAQMKELRPYRKIYLSTKHKIQKVLMKAQLKIERN